MHSSILAAALFLAFTARVRAQGGPSLLARHHFELGLTGQSIHRTIRYTDGQRQGADWRRLAAFLRVGLTGTIAADVNGLAWHRGSTDQFPNRDYFDFSFGAGITFTPYRRGAASIALTVHFHDLTNLDQSNERFSKRSRQLALGALLTRNTPILDQSTHLWLGPVYVLDWLVQYPPFDVSLRGRSLKNAGAVAGASLILARRMRLFGQLVYVAAWQSETGLSLLL